MRRIIFSLLLICSLNVSAKADDYIEDIGISPLVVIYIYDEQNSISVSELDDLVDREIKVGKCAEDYIKKQSKSYAKIVQNNLYDLIHNFDRITSKIYGKKPEMDEIPYDEKVEALARIQCEAYYSMGALK
jgi:hypothetical protein